MRIFIARHGKTFGPDQIGGKKEVMAGSKQDLPLVQEGREQAVKLAKFFKSNEIHVKTIYANSLKRVWEFAEIIKTNLSDNKVELVKDQSLIELDYGAWGGLETSKENNEVVKLFSKEAWNNWQNQRIVHDFPPHNWTESEEDIEKRVEDFFIKLQNKHSANDTVLAIGSQGSITFINGLIEGGMERAIAEDHIKVGPGNICEFELSQGKLKLVQWNLSI
ncbi:MAG: histidine phosphatase family protein [Proteobacteria bacterium]|nr:histidine phosphatase family protein [Pseudomonadota bacterium]